MVQEWKETLPCYNLCGMHMPSGRLINHHSTRQCDNNMQMLWQRRDIAITSQCAEVFSSIKGEDGAECI